MWSWWGFVDSVVSVLRKLMLGLFAQQGPEQGRPPMLMKWRWNSMLRWIFLLLCRENRQENRTAICQSGCNLEVNK